MAIARVAHVGLVPSSNAGGTTSGITTTGANMIYLAVSHYAPGGSVVVSDSKGNSYTLVRNQNDATTVSAIALYVCFNPVVGTGHTFTLAISGATGYPSMTVGAYSGINTGAGVDQQASAAATSPTSITPSVANSLVISAASANGTSSGQTFSVNSSFSIQDQTPYLSGSYFGNASADIIQGAASAVNPTWSYSAGLQNMATLIVSFKPVTSATETGTAVLGFSGISFVGAGADRHSGSGTLAFNGVSFVGTGTRAGAGAGNLAFHGISFVGVGGRKETGIGNLAFRGISFVGAGAVTHVKGTGTLAFGGIRITASGFDAGVPGGLRQFWTC